MSKLDSRDLVKGNQSDRFTVKFSETMKNIYLFCLRKSGSVLDIFRPFFSHFVSAFFIMRFVNLYRGIMGMSGRFFYLKNLASEVILAVEQK